MGMGSAAVYARAVYADFAALADALWKLQGSARGVKGCRSEFLPQRNGKESSELARVRVCCCGADAGCAVKRLGGQTSKVAPRSLANESVPLRCAARCVSIATVCALLPLSRTALYSAASLFCFFFAALCYADRTLFVD